METNKVTLIFNDNIIGLAGYEYGQQIYEKQVNGNIDINETFYIEIPSNIQFVASSFVQGFFSKIIDQIGLSSTEERAEIVSDNSKLKEKFLSKLM